MQKLSKKDIVLEMGGVILRDAVDMGFAGFFFGFGIFFCAKMFGIF